MPVVFDGRVRRVDEDAVLADIAQLVAAGARHITFGDPDFLNAPPHSRRIVAAMHERFPDVTFDCTVKVEHVLRHADVWPEFAAAGCVFVVSAFESVDDAVLERLDKGHTTADAARAVAILRDAGIEVRPSWMPFTPWTTRDDVIALLDFVHEHDLVGSVDPVQYSVRLLLPEGSLLLDHPDLVPFVGPWDPERSTYTWAHPDPAVDELQQRIADHRGQRRRPDRALRPSPRRCRRAARRPRRRHHRPAAPQRELVLLRRTHRAPTIGDRHPGFRRQSERIVRLLRRRFVEVVGQSPRSTLRAEPARNQAMCSSDIVCVVEMVSLVPSAWWMTTSTGRPGARSASPTMSIVSWAWMRS